MPIERRKRPAALGRYDMERLVGVPFREWTRPRLAGRQAASEGAYERWGCR